MKCTAGSQSTVSMAMKGLREKEGGGRERGSKGVDSGGLGGASAPPLFEQ